MRRKFYLIIFLLFAFFAWGVGAAQAQSPGIFFSVPAKQGQEGQRITVDVRVRSPLQSINAVSGAISFPPSQVGIAAITKGASIIDIWTREPKALAGKITFEGVVL